MPGCPTVNVPTLDSVGLGECLQDRGVNTSVVFRVGRVWNGEKATHVYVTKKGTNGGKEEGEKQKKSSWPGQKVCESDKNALKNHYRYSLLRFPKLGPFILIPMSQNQKVTQKKVKNSLNLFYSFFFFF